MINLQDSHIKKKSLGVIFVVLLCVFAIATTATYIIDPGVPNIDCHITALKEDVTSIDTHLGVIEKTLERIEVKIDALVERNNND